MLSFTIQTTAQPGRRVLPPDPPGRLQQHRDGQREWREVEGDEESGMDDADQCDQIGRFIGLWATFKAFGNN